MCVRSSACTFAAAQQFVAVRCKSLTHPSPPIPPPFNKQKTNHQQKQPKPAGDNLVEQWAKRKAETEAALKMVATYKDLGDVAGEPYLKHHDPRTFEDLDKPIPDFRKFGLKAGEVPRFFDSVLSARAADAAAAKDAWWARRRETALEAVAERKFPPMPPLPVPKWEAPGKPVPLESLKASTDALFKQMEPRRKLSAPGAAATPAIKSALAEATKALGAEASAALAESVAAAVASKVVVTENGRPVPNFKFTSAAEAEAKLHARRVALHARFVKMWAKRIVASPEQALVPLKERDALLASKFEDVSDKHNELLALVARGEQTYGERLASCAATDGFFLRRAKGEIAAQFPPSDKEKEAAQLAKELKDPSAALARLLGPALEPPGAGRRPRSEEVRALTEHLYAPDRLMYSEGMKLADRYAKEEAAAAAEAKRLYGDDGAAAALAASSSSSGPRPPAAELAARAKAGEARVKALQAELAEVRASGGGNPYVEYALTREIAFASDPSNAALDEVLHPELIAERAAIEARELDDQERALDEAEEEELWLLTLQRQARHVAAHLEFDLPQAQLAHMDPLLYKKLDWEVTHGHDVLHHEAFQAADCEQGEYIKEQMGLENLSHHLLPLIRYRRHKARRERGHFAPEMVSPPGGHAAAADA